MARNLRKLLSLLREQGVVRFEEDGERLFLEFGPRASPRPVASVPSSIGDKEPPEELTPEEWVAKQYKTPDGAA